MNARLVKNKGYKELQDLSRSSWTSLLNRLT